MSRPSRAGPHELAYIAFREDGGGGRGASAKSSIALLPNLFEGRPMGVRCQWRRWWVLGRRKMIGAVSGLAVLTTYATGCAVYGTDLLSEEGAGPTDDSPDIARKPAHEGEDAGEPPVFDAGRPDSDAVPHDTEGRPPACSLHGGYRIKLTIQNLDPTHGVEATWVDWACVEHLQKRITAKSSAQVTSYVGHVWRIRDEETSSVVKEIPALTGDTVITIP